MVKRLVGAIMCVSYRVEAMIGNLLASILFYFKLRESKKDETWKLHELLLYIYIFGSLYFLYTWSTTLPKGGSVQLIHGGDTESKINENNLAALYSMIYY